MKNTAGFASSSHQPIPANPEDHLMPIAQITSDAFADGKFVQEIADQYIGNCHYDFNTTRLIFDGDELIHHWGVWGYPMRLESATLKVAGIGAVVTREPYRERGLMAMAANDSFKAMVANGYDLSVLRGRHYVKFGYTRAWNYITYRLKAEEIPAYDLSQPYKILEPVHLSEINSVYNQSHSKYTGTAIRPTYRNPSSETISTFRGWFDDNRKLTGYVRALPSEDKKTLQCFEAAGDPRQGLAVLAKLFTEDGYETLTFFTMPRQHPILKILRRGACIIEDRYFHNTGWRVKLINLKSTLGKILPLLEARLQKSHLLNWKGELHLDGGEHQANLKVESGRIKILDAAPSSHNLQAGASLARFLIGSDDPKEIIQQEGVVCRGDADELIEVIFPNLHPMLSHFDEY